MKKRELDIYAEKHYKKIKKSPVGKQILIDLMHWRDILSSNITLKNQGKILSEEDLDEAVQRILDRLIFIRFCEDKELEEKILQTHLRDWRDHQKKHFVIILRDIFEYFNEVYNGKLFRPHLCDDLMIDDEILEEIIGGLHHTKDRNIFYNFADIEADVLGNMYEQYLGHILKKTVKKAKIKKVKSHRKEHGIYFTPTYIVDYIVKNTLGELLKDKKVNAEKIKVLDPACGSGSFLIKVFDYLEKHFKEKASVQQELEFARKTKILTNNIFGVDLDPKAVEIAQLNLLLKTTEKKHRLPDIEENIREGNSLIDDSQIAGNKAFKWEEKFKEIMNEGGFDVVIGNPPYFNIKQDDILKKAKDFSLLLSGVLNAATLFLKKGIDLLKNGGFLGFIIPKSFLIVDSWYPIRKIILENYNIKSVYDVGIAFEEVGLEQVIIILQKDKSSKNNINIIREGEQINIIPQNFFEKKRVILTSLDKEKYPLILKMEMNSTKLSEFSDMPRGLTVKSSEYILAPSSDIVQVLGGTNVERYRKKEGSKRKPNRYLDKQNQKILQKKFIFEKERLIYQNIASSVPRIVATIENKKLPTDDTLNNLTCQKSDLSIKYILAILNSKLTTFYLRYAIINCSVLTVHLDKPYLGKVPIKIIPKSQQELISSFVDKMLSLNKRFNELGDKQTDERAKIEEQIKKTDEEIDRLVYKIYGITKEEQRIIEESLK
ncbi:MAG: N-6 DNA methylase [DPANN group archaeon]|nr:N-6 DNA methylase [DPANN group archaeon]